MPDSLRHAEASRRWRKRRSRGVLLAPVGIVRQPQVGEAALSDWPEYREQKAPGA